MSYATKTEADTYHGARLTAAAWAALADATKTASLQDATDAMDAYASAQGGWIDTYTALTYPTALKNACCLEALELSRPETDARKRAQQQGVKSISIGGASESYEGLRPAATVLSSQKALALIRPYLNRVGSGVAIT